MNWNFENKLTEFIAQAVHDTGVGSEYTFEVCNEQMFVKLKSLDPNKIYVVVKYLSTTETLKATTQPIQLLISCEQNQIQVSEIVFSKLVDSHNFEVIIDNGTFIKQDYRQPVVLSNFNEVSYGYRTIMYISATLLIMENVMDINSFKIGTETIEPISFTMTYSMTPNTQQIPPDKLATSVKSLATFSIAFAIPLLNTYTFVSTVASIMSGSTTGNTSFDVSFKLGNTKFGYFDTGDTHLYMKLISAQVTTAINEIPGLQIGMMR